MCRSTNAVGMFLAASSAVFTQSPKDARKLLEDVTAVGEVLRGALVALGMREDMAAATAAQVRVLHFFKQDVTNQTSYDWHVDCRSLVKLLKVKGTKLAEKERQALGIRTVVVQLGAACETAMCMWRFKSAVYGGRGAGQAFHGSAVHRGVPWIARSSVPCRQRCEVWKLSAFFLPQDLPS